MGSIVLSLDVHCMRTIRNILSNCLNDDDNIVLIYKTISEYLDEKRIPVNTIEELLNHILKEAPQLGAGIRFSSLQLMLRKQIKRLAIGVFPSAYHETILEVIIKQGLHLSILDLSGIWIREDQPVIAEILAKMGEKFYKLTQLTLPYIIMNDNLMQSLGNFLNLTNLQCPGDYTSVSYDTFIRNLSKLKQLQLLNIGYRKIDEHELQLALAKVLHALDSLKSFQEYGFVGKVLEFYQNLVPKQQRTNLIHVRDALTTRNTYKTIVEKCPQLISLELNEPSDQNILKTLSEDFQCLKKLHFQKIECSYLEENRLTCNSLCWQSITIKNAIGTLNLNKIFEIAANLQSLSCEKTEITYWTLNQSKMQLLDNVELIYCEFRYSPQLCNFIQFALRTIRRLLIDNCTQLSDTDFIKNENNVIIDLKLEDLLLQNAQDLTVKTAEYFIKTVPKLRRLGSLDKWKINENDLEHLRNTVQKCGKSIELVTNNG